MTLERRYTLLDRMLIPRRACARDQPLDHAQRNARIPRATRGSGARRCGTAACGGTDRINHTGEVCAQALYVARPRWPAIRRRAAICSTRRRRDRSPGVVCRSTARNGQQPERVQSALVRRSYAIGVAAGLAGDGWNLGFVVETERQSKRSAGASGRAPAGDERSRAILRMMKDDEARHADNAQLPARAACRRRCRA